MDPLATPVTLLVQAAALTGALVTGALGYGLSSITVPVALLFVSNRVLAPALVLIELATNLLGLWTHRGWVPAIWRRVIPLLLGLFPGVALGAWLLSSMAAGSLKLATYALLLPLVVAQTAGRRWPIRRERLAAVPTGAAIGALYGATTISGPPLALFLNNQGLIPTEFRAAIYVIRVAESVATAAVFLAMGLFVPPSVALAGKLVPAVIIGLPLGALLLRRLEPEPFRRVCMGANAAFIAFGLARAAIEMKLASAPLAYGMMAAVAAAEGFLVVRFLVRRPAPIHAAATGGP